MLFQRELNGELLSAEQVTPTEIHNRLKGIHGDVSLDRFLWMINKIS